jgi:hypothetical protein
MAGAGSATSVVSSRDAGPGVTLLASQARTVSGSGADVQSDDLARATTLLLLLDVTAQAGTTPTLDVAIQAKIGAYYVNLARFSQTAAVTGAKLLVTKRDVTLAAEQVPAADPAVGTGLLNNDGLNWLDTLRVKWAIGGTVPSYAFSVVAYPIR